MILQAGQLMALPIMPHTVAGASPSSGRALFMITNHRQQLSLQPAWLAVAMRLLLHTYCPGSPTGSNALDLLKAGNILGETALVEGGVRRLLLQQQQLLRLVANSVSSRLAALLLDELRKQGADSILRLDLTHQEIAQLIGTSRETVTALLSRFVALAMIGHDRRPITVLYAKALASCVRRRLQVGPRQPLPEPRLSGREVAADA